MSRIRKTMKKATSANGRTPCGAGSARTRRSTWLPRRLWHPWKGFVGSGRTYEPRQHGVAKEQPFRQHRRPMRPGGRTGRPVTAATSPALAPYVTVKGTVRLDVIDTVPDKSRTFADPGAL